MWNPFKKSNNQSNINQSNSDDDKPKMNMLQRLAMKKLQKMSPVEQQKIMQEAMKPENRDKLLQAMEMMKKTGQITDEQLNLVKKQMGL